MIYTNNIFNKKPIRMESVKTISYDILPESFDTDMIDSLVHLNEFYYNICKEHSQVTYMGLRYDNVEILHEGFNDFMKNVKEFFTKLINSIVEFFKKAAAYLSSFFVDFDKFIQKHRDLIDKANPNFDIQGYEYTFASTVPDLSPLKDIITDFNRDLGHLDKMTKDEIGKLRTEYMTTDNLDGIRGEVMGIRANIPKEEYLERIQGIYRNGEKDKKTIHIDKSKLNKMVSEYSDLKKTFTDVQKQKNDTVKLITDVKNFFERSARVQYSGKTKVIATNSIDMDSDKLKKQDEVKYAHSADNLDLINLYFKLRFDQSKELSVMITNAFNEKVKALRESLHMHTSVIRKSIFSKTEKDGGDK